MFGVVFLYVYILLLVIFWMKIISSYFLCCFLGRSVAADRLSNIIPDKFPHEYIEYHNIHKLAKIKKYNISNKLSVCSLVYS